MLARTSRSTLVTTVAIVPKVVMIVLMKCLTINVMEEVLTVLLVVISLIRGTLPYSRLCLLKGGFKIYIVTLYMISYIKILLQEI